MLWNATYTYDCRVQKTFHEAICLVKFRKNIFPYRQDFVVILSSALTLSAEIPARVFLIVCYHSVYVFGDVARLSEA